MAASLSRSPPPIAEALSTWTAGRPAKGPAPAQGKDKSSRKRPLPQLLHQPGGLGWGSAGLRRSPDFEILVRTSPSSPGPGPAHADGCAPRPGAHSPRTLAHSARSAAAPAAAGLPWGSRHTPAAKTDIGEREVVREGMWEREMPKSAVT